MLPLIILAGPTTSRKSETAVALAEKLGTEIISADSMQVYKYFDIGTAKPPEEVRRRIPHHLIDILEPDEEFSAFDFKIRALRHIRDLWARRRIPIVVGGTGLYIKVLTEDYDCAIRVSSEIKKQVQKEIQEKGTERMHAELQRLDPQAARRIQTTDALRIERAISVLRETGKTISQFHEEDEPGAHGFPKQVFLFEWDRKELYENINRRVDRMMEAGLVDEVKNLLARGYSKTLKPFQGIGYAQIVDHLEGNILLDRAVYEIKRETRHYAKRQITWFKKVPGLTPLPADASDTPGTLRDKVLSFLPRVAAVGLLAAWFFGGLHTARAEDLSSFQKGVRYFQKARHNKAENMFLGVRNTSAKTMEGKRALYLLGRVHAAKNQDEKAIHFFKTALKEYPEIEDYTRLELARAYSRLNQNSAALKELTHLLDKFPESCLKPRAELFRAQVLKKLNKTKQGVGFLEQALTGLRRGPSCGTSEDILPELIFTLATFHKEIGAAERAYSLLRKLYVRHPTHPLTEQALAEMKDLPGLNKAGVPPLSMDEYPPRLRGLLEEVRYLQVIEEIGVLKARTTPLPGRFYFYLATAHRGLRQRDQANRALRDFLKAYPRHARAQEARVRIGKNLWNLGQVRKAVQTFKKVLREDQKSEWAIKAQYLLGRIYEEKRDYPAAITQYRRLTEKHGDDTFAQAGAWRLGWIHYLDGNYTAAFKQFKTNTTRFPEGLYIEDNLFWKAKTEERMRRRGAAAFTYLKLRRRYPYTFYGVRAGEKLLNLNPARTPERRSSEETAEANPDPAKPFPVPLGRALSHRERYHHVRTVEMSEMGFPQNAKLEIQALQQTVRKNLAGVLWISRLYHRAGAYAESLRLLNLYRNFKTKKHERDLPETFWKFLYPMAYGDLVQTSSRTHQVDPFLINGLIRQESLFDPQSLSPAGARGLMQIMPETGRRLYAQNSNGKPFNENDLYDPDFNIPLGVKYLSQLSKRFGSNGTHLLISYNAGPGTLKKWIKRFQDLNDPEVFIESIPYPETRNYVKKVLRNYGIYKNLYQHPEPGPRK